MCLQKLLIVKILDRYIILQFLLNFVILFVVIMMLFVLVDLIVDLDEFLSAGRDRATGQRMFNISLEFEDDLSKGAISEDLRAVFQANGIGLPYNAVISSKEEGKRWTISVESQRFRVVRDGSVLSIYDQESTWSVFRATLWRIADWYGPMIVLLYTYVSGLLVVGAMAFTFAQLVWSGELIALLTGGVSMYRIAAPVLVAGGLLNTLTLLNQEFVIPHLAHKLARTKSQVEEDQVRTFIVQYVPDDRGNLFSAQSFDPSRSQLNDMSILERRAGGQAVKRITAQQGSWQEDPAGWLLIDGYAMRFSPGHTTADFEPQTIAFFPSNLSPQLLLARRASIYPSLLSLAELRQLMVNPAADSAQYAQKMHSRFSLMVVNVLLLVMALPFFLLREPVNMLQQAIKAASVTLSAWGFGLLLLQIGGPNPVFTAWMPVVILLPASATLLQLVKS